MNPTSGLNQIQLAARQSFVCPITGKVPRKPVMTAAKSCLYGPLKRLNMDLLKGFKKAAKQAEEEKLLAEVLRQLEQDKISSRARKNLVLLLGGSVLVSAVVGPWLFPAALTAAHAATIGGAAAVCLEGIDYAKHGDDELFANVVFRQRILDPFLGHSL